MSENVLLSLAYITASVLFILSLRGLSSQETALRGNLYGGLGMVIAIAAVLTHSAVSSYAFILPAIAVAVLIGAWLAARVAMTKMPELVALLHSFVGGAAVLVGFASYLSGSYTRTGIFLGEIYVDVLIGAITLTGSIIAFLKLSGRMGGKPLLLPGRHFINLGLLAGAVVLAVLFGAEHGSDGLIYLVLLAGVASVLGMHLVMAIGGADMPVVVSLLNSYSGWTASAAGFMLENDLLIVVGALVGSSGAILSLIMCRAMNRSIWNVVFGGFGAAPKKGAGATAAPGEALAVFETDSDGVVSDLVAAKSVVIVPGYGMAVARAQHAVRELTEMLREHGTSVRFGIHPVAGRLPGHMNVLLAEASIPYDIVLEMDEINGDLAGTDVVLVIGANDIVNPGAKTDESSAIYGMPVLEVWDAKRVVMMKRGRAAGYAGVDNPLFYLDNTRMFFGDARASTEKLVVGVRTALSA
ncbi:MAG: NAD(P) transhydrogenase subunit beta [Myxococcota bacterium]